MTMQAHQPFRWIWLLSPLAILLCLSFLFYEARAHPAQPPSQKPPPLQDVTMDVYTQAVTEAKRKAQSKVVEMIVPKKAVSQEAPA